ESVDFGPVTVGAQDSKVLTIWNVGTDTLAISGGKLALGTESVFDMIVPDVMLGTGDSINVVVRFKPLMGGIQADVFTVETNLPLNILAQRPVVQLVGDGLGAEIDLASSVLSFASQGLGASAVQNLLITNRGNDTLRVSDIFVDDVRFGVDVTAFDLGPDIERLVRVTYIPDSSRARIDTLHIVSNDFDEPMTLVVLDAQETPQQVGSARISLARSGIPFPQVGDTVSVSFTLTPNNASIAGVELFFGYDPVLFAPADSRAPFLRVGYTASPLQILFNEVASKSADLEVTHLTSLGGATDSITTEGLLTQMDLVVLSPLTKTTRLRVLVEAPFFNTQFISPSDLSFTMPSSNSVGLGNTPPVMRAFPPLKMSEDEPASLALISLASDAESQPSDLQWSFHDPDSLLVVSISTPDPALGAIARFFAPENASGTFAVTATVSDPAGASDRSVIVVDVAAVNDPPSVLGVSTPGENATGVSSPVILQWSASDADRNDVLGYDVRFGQNRLFLEVVAQSLSDTSYSFPGTLLPDTNYFWQVVVSDAAGAEVEGPVWQFTTESDQVAPTFVAGPQISEVTDSTAAVFWSLDEPATARIVLGLRADLSDSLDFDPVAIADQSRLRTQEVSGLIAGTEYYCQVTVRDAAGNGLVSDILTLTTTGEKPIEPVVTDVGDFTGDRVVSFGDFIVFAAVFNTLFGDLQYIPNADFDSSGAIDFVDFILFSSVFGINYARGN
ncbi:MAG: choice-of-anchor D domain-containing protein, partial [Candidatus Latescibacteria bacterium]|nr:choice-of-anchor D domain-containing protein [Candidatus Latescibacterota bacterium]